MATYDRVNHVVDRQHSPVGNKYSKAMQAISNVHDNNIYAKGHISNRSLRNKSSKRVKTVRIMSAFDEDLDTIVIFSQIFS